jgi:undecaprenyl-diphosphatase
VKSAGDTVSPRGGGAERRAGTRPALRGRLVGLAYGLIRWIGGHVRDFYAALGLFLLIGLALSVGALALFALIAKGVAAGATLRFDDAILLWAHAHTSPVLDGLALLGGALGSGAAAWLAIAGGTVVLWRTRHHWSALLLWASVIGGRILNTELKGFFDRPRPSLVHGDLHLLGVTVAFPSNPSFPSGHAITSVIVFGTLAYLVVRIEPTARLRHWTVGVALAIILLIGTSRIYLGVHYPSDVLAGYLVGFLWATSCALAIEAVRFFRTKKPGVAAEEKGLDGPSDRGGCPAARAAE